MDAQQRQSLAREARDMFYHAYDAYLRHGYPADDVRPFSCQPANSQGGIGVTLMDALDAHLLLNETGRFQHAVSLALERSDFDVNHRAHVFEVTIRVLGGMLAAHVAIAANASLEPFEGAAAALLRLAVDLADRLMPAFNTATGIPLSWINLSKGVIPDDVTHTCVACAATLGLEFRLLSTLTGNATYGAAAAAAIESLFARRSAVTHLVGNTLWTGSGEWQRVDSGIGAGADSYYEYLLKTYLMQGEARYLDMFVDQYVAAMRHMETPGEVSGFQWMLDVHMDTGQAIKPWVSSLSAFWPGLAAAAGQAEAAERLQAAYVQAYRSYGWPPEQIALSLNVAHPTEVAYPQRPETIESAYLLHSLTGAPRHLRTGEGILRTLRARNRAVCGFASVRNVTSGALEDSMESFFLAETSKYLYLLFHASPAPLDFFVLNTEGHLFPVLPGPSDDDVHEAPSAPEAWDGPPAGEASSSTSLQQHELDRDGSGGPDTCSVLCQTLSDSDAQVLAGNAREAFPSLTFGAASAIRLRRRRCRVCRAVTAALAAVPPPDPCARARYMGITLDVACPPEPPLTSQPTSRTSPAPRHDSESDEGSAPAPDVQAFDAVVGRVLERQRNAFVARTVAALEAGHVPALSTVRDAVALCFLVRNADGTAGTTSTALTCSRLVIVDPDAIDRAALVSLVSDNTLLVNIKYSRPLAASGASLIVLPIASGDASGYDEREVEGAAAADGGVDATVMHGVGALLIEALLATFSAPLPHGPASSCFSLALGGVLTEEHLLDLAGFWHEAPAAGVDDDKEAGTAEKAQHQEQPTEDNEDSAETLAQASGTRESDARMLQRDAEESLGADSPSRGQCALALDEFPEHADEGASTSSDTQLHVDGDGSLEVKRGLVAGEEQGDDDEGADESYCEDEDTDDAYDFDTWPHADIKLPERFRDEFRALWHRAADAVGDARRDDGSDLAACIAREESRSEGASASGIPRALRSRLAVASPRNACAGTLAGAATGRYEGAIVLALRGGCSFLDKTRAASAAGAAALVVVNYPDPDRRGTLLSMSAEVDEVSAALGDADSGDAATDDDDDARPRLIPVVSIRRDIGFMLMGVVEAIEADDSSRMPTTPSATDSSCCGGTCSPQQDQNRHADRCSPAETSGAHHESSEPTSSGDSQGVCSIGDDRIRDGAAGGERTCANPEIAWAAAGAAASGDPAPSPQPQFLTAVLGLGLPPEELRRQDVRSLEGTQQHYELSITDALSTWLLKEGLATSVAGLQQALLDTFQASIAPRLQGAIQAHQQQERLLVHMLRAALRLKQRRAAAEASDHGGDASEASMSPAPCEREDASHCTDEVGLREELTVDSGDVEGDVEGARCAQAAEGHTGAATRVVDDGSGKAESEQVRTPSAVGDWSSAVHEHVAGDDVLGRLPRRYSEA